MSLCKICASNMHFTFDISDNNKHLLFFALKTQTLKESCLKVSMWMLQTLCFQFISQFKAYKSCKK
jgi:hypothetical protein